jgi:prolipoprotein diacylglyceryltransferase
MKTSSKMLYLIPRILLIIAILFISLFALDSFSAERTFWQNSGVFLINLIPSFVLLLVLILAWKREKTGGILLTALGLILCLFVFFSNYNRTHSIVTSFLIVLALSIPLVLAGILFIISHYRKKKELSGIS